MKTLLILVAAAIVFTIRVQPLSLGGVPGARDQLTWRAADGREHVYLGDYDSYLWVREARNYLYSGTIDRMLCDPELEASLHRDVDVRRRLFSEERFMREFEDIVDSFIAARA